MNEVPVDALFGGGEEPKEEMRETRVVVTTRKDESNRINVGIEDSMFKVVRTILASHLQVRFGTTGASARE